MNVYPVHLSLILYIMIVYTESWVLFKEHKVFVLPEIRLKLTVFRVFIKASFDKVVLE